MINMNAARSGGRPRRSPDDDVVPRAVVPADVDAADVIAWGLSFRQLAIIVAGAAGLWAAYDRFGRLLPPPVWVAAAILVLAVGVTLALGRRDGLPLDVWLRHGLVLHTTPAVHAPGATTGSASAGRRRGQSLAATTARPVTPAPLRAQVTRIASDGALTVAGTARAVIGCGTTSVALRTGQEQASVLAAFGRWLNALPGRAQIVVSAARLDLTPYADAVLAGAAGIANPALRAAALDYAEFLVDLDVDREPLRRQVLTVVPAGPSLDAGLRGLTALGITARPLDGQDVAAALATAVDPYRPPVPGPRAPVGTPITAHPTARSVAPARAGSADGGRDADPPGGLLAQVDPSVARWLR
jgi:hypothetical protein